MVLRLRKYGKGPVRHTLLNKAGGAGNCDYGQNEKGCAEYEWLSGDLERQTSFPRFFGGEFYAISLFEQADFPFVSPYVFMPADGLLRGVR